MSISSQTTVTAETLRTLHRIHKQLRDLRERLQRGPRLIEAYTARVEKLRQDLDQAKARARSLRMTIDDKQLQLKSREEAVNRRKQQLREAKSNKEFQALKEQIAADEVTNSVLADEILDAMERLDQANREVKAAEEALAKGTEEAQKARQEIEQQTPIIEADLARLSAELRQTEQDLPADFRELYDRLIRSKGSDGLAPVRGEYCAGCNQHVPLNMINALRLSRPVFCRACGRLLYLPEEN